MKRVWSQESDGTVDVSLSAGVLGIRDWLLYRANRTTRWAPIKNTKTCARENERRVMANQNARMSERARYGKIIYHWIQWPEHTL